jgi:beta-galactosidase
MSFFSGIVDENEQIRLGGYPASFRELFGVAVEEFAPYAEAQSNTFRTDDGRQFQCSFWSDIIRLERAQALGTYEQDYYAGAPAITRNTFGKGTAYYVGTVPEWSGMDWLLERVCDAAGIQPVLANAPAGVELLRRTNGKLSWLFILNHSAQKVTVPIEQNGLDLLTSRQVNGEVEIDPAGVAVIQLESSE